jgi:hypothetical protein
MIRHIGLVINNMWERERKLCEREGGCVKERTNCVLS